MTVWCRFGSWGLVIKSNFYPEFQTLSTRFGQDFEVEAQARFWSWSLVSILLLIFGWGYEDYSWSRFWSYVLSSFWSFWSLSLVEIMIFGWSCCLVEIMKMKYDQDFFENLWNDLKKLLRYAEINLRVRCAFGNVYTIYYVILLSSFPMYSFASVSFPNLVPGVFFFIH